MSYQKHKSFKSDYGLLMADQWYYRANVYIKPSGQGQPFPTPGPFNFLFVPSVDADECTLQFTWNHLGTGVLSHYSRPIAFIKIPTYQRT